MRHCNCSLEVKCRVTEERGKGVGTVLLRRSHTRNAISAGVTELEPSQIQV